MKRFAFLLFAFAFLSCEKETGPEVNTCQFDDKCGNIVDVYSYYPDPQELKIVMVITVQNYCSQNKRTKAWEKYRNQPWPQDLDDALNADEYCWPESW